MTDGVSPLIHRKLESLVTTIRTRVERTGIRSILLFGLVIRVLLAPFFGHPADVADYWYYGFALFDLGLDPIPFFNQYGPGPLLLVYLYYWPYTIISTRVFFAFSFKIPLILMEVTMVYFLFLFTRSKMKSLLLALSPVSLATTSIYGQIDAVIPFLLMLSLLLLSRERFTASAFFLAIAAGFKYIALPLLPVFLLLVWRMTSKTGSHVQFARFLAVLLLTDSVLYFPMLLDYAGQTLLLLVAGSSFASSGYGTWRGASVNIWEYLRIDLGIAHPGFLLLFIPFLLFALILAVFTIRSKVQSIIPILVVVPLGFYLLYPTVHMQHLMWALPFVYILDRKWFRILLYNVSFLPRLLSRSTEGYVLEDVRTVLGITDPGATNLALMYFGYFWFTIIVASLLILTLRDAIKPALSQNEPLPCSESRRSKPPLAACFLLVILMVGAIAALIPSQPYETTNRWLYDDQRMSIRHLQLSPYGVNGSTEVNLLIDEDFLTGYIRDGTSCVLVLNSSASSHIMIYFNTDMVFDANASSVAIDIPVALLQVRNNLTVVAAQWVVDRTDLYLLFDLSSLPPFYTVFPAALVASAVLASCLFASGEILVRKLVCRLV